MKFYYLFILVFMFSCETNDSSYFNPILNSYVCEENTNQYNKLIEEFVNDQTYVPDVDDYVKQGFENHLTVFAGSSTIAKWPELELAFSEFHAVNRGLAGSNIGHLILHSENLIFKNTPEILVLYVGDNDVFHFDIDSFKRYLDCFIDNFFYRLPNAKLVLISVKPSPERMYVWDYYLDVNQHLIWLAHNGNGRISYVDIWTPIMSSPDYRSYFQRGEYVHFNAKGHQLMADCLVPVLQLIKAQTPH